MFLLVPAHPGCPGQNPKSCKTVVCVCVCVCVTLLALALWHNGPPCKWSGVEWSSTVVHALVVGVVSVGGGMA